MKTLGILILIYFAVRYGRYLYNTYLKQGLEGNEASGGRNRSQQKDIHVDFNPNDKKEGYDDGEYIDYEEVDDTEK